MLVLTRRVGEAIIIDDNIRITVLGIQGGKIRLGIETPPSVAVDREEVHQRRKECSDWSAGCNVDALEMAKVPVH